MAFEKSAGVVIFTQHHFIEKSLKKQSTKNGAGLRKEKDKIYYLLLHYPSGSRSQKDYWDFSKGHIEKGEKPEDTARREAKEETGIKDLKFINGFKEWIKYFFKFKEKNIFKIVTFYLAETKTEEIKISPEHIGFQWLLYEQAAERLKFKNAKEILKKADSFIKKSSAVNY